LSNVPPLGEQNWRRWGTPWRRFLARVQVSLWRVWMRCKRGFAADAPAVVQTPLDPAIKFPHPGNRELFEDLKRDAQPDAGEGGTSWYPDGYKIRAHPDLIEILGGLVASDQVTSGFAYGCPVVANPKGLIFAQAGGTHSIFIRLRPEHHEAARLDNGRLDPTYGTEWLEFPIGGLVGGPTDWSASMKRWATVSYQDSLKAG
jgi:hypothetical protein